MAFSIANTKKHTRCTILLPGLSNKNICIKIIAYFNQLSTFFFFYCHHRQRRSNRAYLFSEPLDIASIEPIPRYLFSLTPCWKKYSPGASSVPASMEPIITTPAPIPSAWENGERKTIGRRENVRKTKDRTTDQRSSNEKHTRGRRTSRWGSNEDTIKNVSGCRVSVWVYGMFQPWLKAPILTLF